MAVYLVPTHLSCLNSCHLFSLFLLHSYSSIRLSYMKLPILNLLDYKSNTFTFQPRTLVYSSHYITSLWTPAFIHLALFHLLPHTQPPPTFTWLILTHLLGLCFYSPFCRKLVSEKKGGGVHALPNQKIHRIQPLLFSNTAIYSIHSLKHSPIESLYLLYYSVFDNLYHTRNTCIDWGFIHSWW